MNRQFIYCSGWRDFKNMGISVIACHLQGFNQFKDGFYNFANLNNYIPFACQTFQDILAYKPLLIGFNSHNFDDALLRANNIIVNSNYDVLEEIRMAGYGSRQWKKQPPGWSYDLDAIARANGMKKTGRSELAPRLWQQGERQKVSDYCLNDVFLTVNILKLGQEGKLIDPNTGKYLKLRSLKS
jgi:DEAD/DEAH box helicase domain-containing protein